MGLLVDGEWQDVWYDTKSNGGAFKRSESQFRNWLTADGRAEQQALEDMTALGKSETGTRALLRRISLGAEDSPESLPQPDLKVE